ncbi:MAG: pilus assembly protein [Clostridiales Family XIII bacterium]|jgi:hypothetical protein|nr:pilus assembly protein [Clostridiales Family XIII bacterium]
MGRVCSRRGSLAVEAAILLPIFMVAVISLGYLLKLAGIEEMAVHTLTDESRKLASEAAVLPSAISFKKDVRLRLEDEGNGDVEDAEVSTFWFRIPGVTSGGRYKSDLIIAEASYTVPLRIPRIFIKEIEGSNLVVSRAFVGRFNDGGQISFDEMETDDDDVMVWVFPRSGERYHGENCRYIANKPKEFILDAGIKRQYKACGICHPGGEPYGSLVYCFTDSGKAYHIGSCDTVEKYVISMSEQEAKDRGYTACSVCGGR